MTTITDRQTWLALRRKSVGASDAATIAGLNPYKSRFALWLEKTQESDADSAGEEARWGLRLEDDMEDELSLRGVRFTQRQVFCTHPRDTWCHATIDGIDTDTEIWELKPFGCLTPWFQVLSRQKQVWAVTHCSHAK